MLKMCEKCYKDNQLPNRDDCDICNQVMEGRIKEFKSLNEKYLMDFLKADSERGKYFNELQLLKTEKESLLKQLDTEYLKTTELANENSRLKEMSNPVSNEFYETKIDNLMVKYGQEIDKYKQCFNEIKKVCVTNECNICELTDCNTCFIDHIFKKIKEVKENEKV